MADNWASRSAAEQITCATHCVAMVSTTVYDATRAVFCDADGDYDLVFLSGSTAAGMGLKAGVVYPFRITSVTGTGLYALY